MFKLFKHLKPYILFIVVLIILVYIQAIANLQLPTYMADIINKGILGKNNSEILKQGILMLVISLLGGAATIGVSYFASKVGAGFSKDIREKLFTKIENFSLQEFDKFSTASLITRSTNDIQQIQMVVIMLLRMVLYAPILGIGAIFKAYSTAPSISWLIIIPVAVLIGVITGLFAVAVPKFQSLQKLTDRLNLVTRENLTGLRVIRAFNNETYEESKFDKANIDVTNVNLFVNRAMSLMMPMMLLIFNITAIGIIWVGSHQIQSGNLAIGDMIAFMQYAMQVIMSFLMISIVFVIVPRAAVSGQRVSQVLNTEISIKDPTNPKQFSSNIKGEVEFRNVTFSYPNSDTPVLTDISFKAHSGETTAFIGSTGSGKSTLINLIPRLYDVTKGEVLVDGIDVRDVLQSDLHNKIGYVPQKGMLFSGTVNSNIRFGNPDANDNEIQESANVAQANEFIQKLENKFESPISQGGTNVSGGQKQRLSIARAIVRNPEIYIFDDSFSALDFKTDARLRKAIKEKTDNSTVLIVTQRISTIIGADQIVVLDEGKIVGIGKHHELLDGCKVYRELALSQLSEEEINKTEEPISIKEDAAE